MATVITREQGYPGLANEIIRINTTSTLAQVTTAGWYNNSPIAGESISSVDTIQICYSYGTSLQATKIFNVSVNSLGVVTLSVAESSVILPVVSGHFANFSGTSGAIADDGYLPTNAALTRVVMQSGASVVGNLPKYNDVTGTIVDSGIPFTNYQPLIASVTLNTTAMQAAYTTPQTLIANPLSSQMILVLSAAVYTASTGNTPYATGTAPIIQYSSGGTNGAHGTGTIATASGLVAGDITAATSQVRNLFEFATGAQTGLSGLGIYFSNATGNYTAGTGTNVTFTLVYLTLTATV